MGNNPDVPQNCCWIQGVTTSKRGELYIADGYRIRKIDPMTGIIESIVGVKNNHDQMKWQIPPQFLDVSTEKQRYVMLCKCSSILIYLISMKNSYKFFINHLYFELCRQLEKKRDWTFITMANWNCLQSSWWFIDDNGWRLFTGVIQRRDSLSVAHQ